MNLVKTCPCNPTILLLSSSQCIRCTAGCKLSEPTAVCALNERQTSCQWSREKMVRREHCWHHQNRSDTISPKIIKDVSLNSINSKTIDPHQITNFTDLSIPKTSNPHEITVVRDDPDCYRMQDHCRWCVGVSVWVLCGVACVGVGFVWCGMYVYVYVYVLCVVRVCVVCRFVFWYCRVLCCVVMCGVGAGVGAQCVVCGVCGVCA